MDFNTEANRAEMIEAFPALADDCLFKITSAISSSYNCIAWAMGFENRWGDYETFQGQDLDNIRFSWWPEGIEKSLECRALIKAFEALGFRETKNSNYDPEFDKAVLYSNHGLWTHASRITGKGVEHSKFGSQWDAYHGQQKFSGTIYGTPFAYMERPHKLKKYFLDLHPLKMGKININERLFKINYRL